MAAMQKVTEARNPASVDIDLLSTEEILRVINSEDQTVPGAIREIIPALARAVEDAADRIRRGGRVFYVGAGTSGRLGVLDAAELPPTFGVSSDLFQGIIAGGYVACYSASEVSEDDPEQGARDLEGRGCAASDVVAGIAASGTTPYVRGALLSAKQKGSLTIAICCNPDSALSSQVDHALTPVVGPEVISGSTRMKAGTAQKLVLNMFSTATMIRLGHVYSNWMINVRMTNSKLKRRGLRILMEVTGLPEETCRGAMIDAGADLKVALVMLLRGASARAARSALEASRHDLRKSLESLTPPRR